MDEKLCKICGEPIDEESFEMAERDGMDRDAITICTLCASKSLIDELFSELQILEGGAT